MAASQSITCYCSRCRQDLPSDLFRRFKDGSAYAYCSPCEKQYKRDYYLKNKERIKAKSVAWSAANHSRKLATSRAYHEKNKATLAPKKKKYYEANKAARVTYSVEWRKRNLDSQRQVEAAYRERNRKICNERISAWKKRNPEKVRIYTLVRGRTQKEATPAWADLLAIRTFYERAAELRKSTGQDWHVDHIVPLIHPKVCGLHCEANLEVITARENNEKGNRWWPDMPEEKTFSV